MLKGNILPGKVLLKRVEKVTKSGIIITEQSQDSELIGEVVLVGPSTEKFKIDLPIGTKVLFSKFSNNQNNNVVINDQKYLLLAATEIQYIFAHDEL